MSILSKENLQNLSGGSTFRELSKTVLGRLYLPFPPLEEQQKIAHVLMSIDKAIETVDEAIAKAERIKKGLMQELLTKGIGHKEFKDTEIGRIPKDWEVVRLEDVASIKGRIGWHGLRDEDYLTEGEYYLVRGTEFENGKILWEKCVYISKEWYEKDPNIQLKEGDILPLERFAEKSTKNLISAIQSRMQRRGGQSAQPERTQDRLSVEAYPRP